MIRRSHTREISNGRKIGRITPILTIFTPNFGTSRRFIARTTIWLKHRSIQNFQVWGILFSPGPETPPPGHHLQKMKNPKIFNDRKIARMAPILTIFEPKSSQRRDLFFEKFPNERKKERKKRPHEHKLHRPGRRYHRWYTCLRFL